MNDIRKNMNANSKYKQLDIGNIGNIGNMKDNCLDEKLSRRQAILKKKSDRLLQKTKGIEINFIIETSILTKMISLNMDEIIDECLISKLINCNIKTPKEMIYICNAFDLIEEARALSKVPYVVYYKNNMDDYYRSRSRMESIFKFETFINLVGLEEFSVRKYVAYIKFRKNTVELVFENSLREKSSIILNIREFLFKCLNSLKFFIKSLKEKLKYLVTNNYCIKEKAIMILGKVYEEIFFLNELYIENKFQELLSYEGLKMILENKNFIGVKNKVFIDNRIGDKSYLYDCDISAGKLKYIRVSQNYLSYLDFDSNLFRDKDGYLIDLAKIVLPKVIVQHLSEKKIVNNIVL